MEIRKQKMFETFLFDKKRQKGENALF